MADFSPPLPPLLQTTLESTKHKFPSTAITTTIPPNYVTLQQLQERRLKRQQQQRQQKEREEKEAEQRKKQLELEESLKTLEIKASGRSSRPFWSQQRKNKADELREIPAAEAEIDGQGESIEGSEKKKRTREGKRNTKPKERKALADGEQQKPLLDLGKEEEEVSKPEVEKSGGRGFQSVEEDDRTAKNGRRRVADGRSTAGKNVDGNRMLKQRVWLPSNKPLEKIGSKGREGRTVEVNRNTDCGEMEGSNGNKEVEKTAEKKPNWVGKKHRKDRMVEIAQKKGNAVVVDCEQTLEEAEGGKDADERSIAAKNELELGRTREKMPSTGQENGKEEEDRVEPMLEIAHKIGELEIVDGNEVDGENVGESLMVDRKLDYRRLRDGRSFGRERGFGYGRGFGNGRGYGRGFGNRRGFGNGRGYGRGFGNRRGFGYHRGGFAYEGRREPQHLTWIRKEEHSNRSMLPLE